MILIVTRTSQAEKNKIGETRRGATRLPGANIAKPPPLAVVLLLVRRVVIMKTHIKKSIEKFKERWLPQTIPVAEAIFSRFIAGESSEELQQDYGVSVFKVESAIRFFALKWSGNRHARELYDDWQRRRFQ